MRLTILSILSVFVLNGQAELIDFNVVSPGSKSVHVSIGGKWSKLKKINRSVPLFKGTFEVNPDVTYKYVADRKPESFERTLPTSKSTFNEFYGRPITYAALPELPRPLDNGKEWTRATKNSDLFDTNYIPSIFVHGEPSEMNLLIKTTPKTVYPVNITYVGKDYVKTFYNVSFAIHAAGKKHNPQKQSWRWTLAPGDFINDRNTFKIRHMEEDPTQMREKLYADCLRAMGTYANQANMVRFFINNRGFGTFNMLDDVTEYSYIRAQFYNGNPPAKMGPLFDGSTGASFDLAPTPWDYSSFQPTIGSPEGSEAIDPLAKKLHKLNATNDASVSQFGKKFDIDQFLRFMIMEYLTGSWDGYWMMQTNDGAYKDYANHNMWYYLGQDYDSTFGINLVDDIMNTSYRDYPEKYPNATLINTLLKNSKIKSTFESYLIDTVNILFNNETLGNHIMAYREFISPDLKWDRSIKQLSNGIKFGWTFNDTYDNIFKAVYIPNVGGAGFGLTEWIVKKVNFVKQDLGI